MKQSSLLSSINAATSDLLPFKSAKTVVSSLKLKFRTEESLIEFHDNIKSDTAYRAKVEVKLPRDALEDKATTSDIVQIEKVNTGRNSIFLRKC